MINERYDIAYVQVLEILKYISQEYYNKIPKEKIDFFKENSNKEYRFKYDTSKSINDQNVLELTKGIIIAIFRDYWATSKQREKIINMQKIARIKAEELKKETYNPNDIFKNRNKDNYEDKNNISENQDDNTEKSIIVYKENVFTKLFNNLKKIIKKFSSH